MIFQGLEGFLKTIKVDISLCDYYENWYIIGTWCGKKDETWCDSRALTIKWKMHIIILENKIYQLYFDSVSDILKVPEEKSSPYSYGHAI